jgi:hypothetical protein
LRIVTSAKAGADSDPLMGGFTKMTGVFKKVVVAAATPLPSMAIG